jgi:predicted dehydrogenase
MTTKIRIAIIGTGMIANAAHIPAINNLRKQGLAELVGVADIRLEAAAETARRQDIPHYFQDPQQMLDELRPDLVAVCTPNVYHKQWSIAALRAGCHVACEKPMAVSLADAREMFAVAEACGKMLFPCQCMRWRSYMQTARELIANGEIGTPYFSDIAFIRRFGIPTWGLFHMKEHNFGGPFCDLGVHLIDSLLWIAGGPKVEAVSGCAYQKIVKQGQDVLVDIAESGAYAGTFTPRPYDWREFSVEEFATGFMRLENGFSVNFKFSWAINLPTTNLNMVVCGDQGGISLNENKLYKNVGRYQAETALKAFDNRPYKGTAFEQHWYMYEHLMDVLAGKAERLVKPEETCEVAKAIECFYQSAALNREVNVKELVGYEK